MTNSPIRLLIVDDEEAMRKAYQDALSPKLNASTELTELEEELFGEGTRNTPEEAFEVICLPQGEDAIKEVDAAVKSASHFSVAFIDIRMPPGIDGVETARRIRELDPLINIVIVTGYSDKDISEIAKQLQPADKLFFLAKPVQVAEIRQQARSLSARWRSENTMMETLRHQNEVLRKSVEEARIAKEQALAASHAKSSFIANVSHELRTPLNAVIGFSNMMASELYGPLGDQRYIDYAKEIESAGSGLLKAINDMIDTSRLDLGCLKLEVEELNLAACINTVIMELKAFANTKNVSFQTELLTPDCMISGDAKRVNQIIHAVAHNAIKFSNQNSLIMVSLIPAGSHATITIADSGAGITADMIEMTNHPFIHEANVLSRSHGGLGLGLWLSKRLIEVQGGNLTISANCPTGTRVTLEFPISTKSVRAA